MNSVYHDIFKAIHEGKWLDIEYKNKENDITKYWIGIYDLNVRDMTLSVEGLHLAKYTTKCFDFIYIDSILSSKIIESSYFPINQKLVNDISLNPHKFKKIFDNTANLKILNYLEMCNRMDTIPYYSDFQLIEYIDRDSFNGEEYALNPEQFQKIVNYFHYSNDKKKKKSGGMNLQYLGINVLSINTNRGLYVLAYRKLNLDVKQKVMRPDEDITICSEFTIDGSKEHIRKFLDADEYELLEDFEENQEKIKDCITAHGNPVDDMPYIIGLGMDIVLDLHEEYNAIIDMYNQENVTVPIKAFFGDLLNRPDKRKSYPITLINNKINLDQLLAINNAMKYPVAYIQGPPGTGKTNTIINTIITAFFNEKTVLFVSYNNHPIDGVYETLSKMEYRDKVIPFPVLRLGNVEKMKEALDYITRLYNQAKEISVFESTLDKNKDDRINRTKRLSEMLKKYERILDLRERKETIKCLLDNNEKENISIKMLPFQTDLQDRQIKQIEDEIRKLGSVSNEEALELVDNDINELKKYLYYTSARYIKKLNEPKNRDLLDILQEPDKDKKVTAFSKYLSKTENIKKLQKIFPIIITTCISSHKLGKPEPIFDMTIMDEASQCNIAVALVPIIRGEQLMLVGDPQQLSPVILLDEITNAKLKRKYLVQDEYDYRKNSIYKAYLACDAVSDETLLRYHYRCNKKIIQFNNKKYYNNMLQIKTESNEEQPLVYADIKDEAVVGGIRNTSQKEADVIIEYAKLNKDKSIGVITPFVNQKNMIEEMLVQEKINNVDCGTVHAFQGDEKDIILFSTAITDNTYIGTYNWLKNNKELINVATSRAKDKLIVLSNYKNIERLHKEGDEDDLFELIQYVKSNGTTTVTEKHANSRALGVKPFSTKTEDAFMENLNHALGNIWLSQTRYMVEKEVGISAVFKDNITNSDLFYSGRFDFVVYEKKQGQKMPVFAIELNGKEHYDDEKVKARDAKKKEICKQHNFELITVENSYARRYNYIKEILIDYFKKMR